MYILKSSDPLMVNGKHKSILSKLKMLSLLIIYNMILPQIHN